MHRQSWTAFVSPLEPPLAGLHSTQQQPEPWARHSSQGVACNARLWPWAHLWSLAAALCQCVRDWGSCGLQMVDENPYKAPVVDESKWFTGGHLGGQIQQINWQVLPGLI